MITTRPRYSPTAPSNSNNTRIANTEWVKSILADYALLDSGSMSIRVGGVILYDSVGDGDYFLSADNTGLDFNGNKVITTAGGQTINGALTASGTVTNQGIRLLQAAGGSLRGVLNCPSWDISYVALRNGTLAETAANTGFYQSSQGDSALNAASGRGASISIANVSVVGVTSGAVAITGTLSYTGSLVFPELVTNGDFSVGTGWAMGVGWSISGGVAVATGVVSFRDIQQNLPAVELGRTYIISFSVSLTSGSVQVFLGSSGSGPGAVTTINGSGTYSFLHHKSPADTIRTILFRGGAAFTGTIDNVSVKRAF